MRVSRYLLATLVQTASSFLAVALLSRILTTDEYGRWALYEPFVLLSAQIASIGSVWGVLKLIARDNVPVFIAARVSLLYNILPITITAIAGAYFSINYMNSYSESIYISAWIVSESFLAILLSVFRGANKAEYYFKSACARASIILVGLAMSGIGLISFDKAENVAAWWSFASATSVIVLFFGLFKFRRSSQCINSSNRLIYKSSITYGFPILIAAVLAAILSNADRYILSTNMSPTNIGYYAITIKIASILNLLVTPLNLWWPTARFNHMADIDNGNAFFSRSIIQFVTLFFFFGVILWLSAPIILYLMAPSLILNPLTLGLLILSAILMALSVPFNVGALKEGKTFWNIIIVGVSAGIQVCLCFYLSHTYGVTGAAISTCSSSFISLLLTIVISQKLYYIDWPFLEIFKIVLFSIFSLLSTYFVLDSHFGRTGIAILFFSLYVFVNKKKYYPLIR